MRSRMRRTTDTASQGSFLSAREKSQDHEFGVLHYVAERHAFWVGLEHLRFLGCMCRPGSQSATSNARGACSRPAYASSVTMLVHYCGSPRPHPIRNDFEENRTKAQNGKQCVYLYTMTRGKFFLRWRFRSDKSTSIWSSLGAKPYRRELLLRGTTAIGTDRIQFPVFVLLI